MKILRYLFILLCCSVMLTLQNLKAQANKLHNVPMEFVSGHFQVFINGEAAQVFHAGINVFYVSFEMDGETDVKVIRTTERLHSVKTVDAKYAGQVLYLNTDSLTGANFWGGRASVKPLSKKVTCSVQGDAVSFSIGSPGQYSLERPGTSNFMDAVLFLFANRPETSKPDKSNPDVIWLEPGVHQKNLMLKSGQTLYLDAGAVLFGSVDIWNAENVTIAGHGSIVYYGPQSEIRDYGYKHLEKWHPLTTHNVNGLKVSGISIIGRSRTWLVQLRATSNVVFDNVKVLSVNRANINGDGFDFQGGENILVVNSLIRSADDAFAFFPSDPIIYARDSGQHLSSKYPGVKNVLIENCVIWSTLANIYRLVPGRRNFVTDNIAMRNCDVIHVSRGFWWAPWSLVCTIDPSKIENSLHTNYLFEDIRFEEPVPLFGLQGGTGIYRNFTFRNIQMSGIPDSSLFEGQVEGLLFDNVWINNKKVTSFDDLLLNPANLNKKNVKFK